jgi:hypothetical protein
MLAGGTPPAPQPPFPGKDLTLDQIDARDVKVQVALKKSYRTPRIRISNAVLRMQVHPRLPLPVANLLLRLAVEARRRLRHPLDVPWATPIEGIAWGRLEADGKTPVVLVVTIDGKEKLRVSEDELKKKEEKPDGQPQVA